MSLSPRVGVAPEHFLLGTWLMFWRLPEGMWIQSRECRAERALPSPCLLSPLLPQVPWSMYTCLFPLSPRRTKRSTQLPCCGPAKWAPSLTCGGTGTTPRWVGFPGRACVAPLGAVKGKKSLILTQEPRSCGNLGNGRLWEPHSSLQYVSVSLTPTPLLLPLPSCESGFFSTWALLCSDPQQQPELSVVTAQWSKWAIFPKILTGIPEQSYNTGHALIMVLVAETELFKSTFLDLSRREGREWLSKGEETSGHQTDKSHRCLSSPPLAPCSPFWIRHGPPCPMAPPPHDSPAWVRNGPLFSSASCSKFLSNTRCDPKSAASSNQWRPWTSCTPSPSFYRWGKWGGHRWSGFLQSHSATSRRSMAFLMPVWVSLPRTPGCMRWFSLELTPFSEIKICLQMSVKAVELKLGIIFPRGPGPMALNGELHLLAAEVPLLITLLFKRNASCVNTNLFLPRSWVLALTGAIISHKPREETSPDTRPAACLAVKGISHLSCWHKSAEKKPFFISSETVHANWVQIGPTIRRRREICVTCLNASTRRWNY